MLLLNGKIVLRHSKIFLSNGEILLLNGKILLKYCETLLINGKSLFSNGKTLFLRQYSILSDSILLKLFFLINYIINSLNYINLCKRISIIFDNT